MTTEMFGAPYGISAAEDQINQNALSGLKAMHTLGEIQQQPVDMQLKQAHARYYGGLAQEAEAKARDLQTMQQLEAGVAAARLAAAQGQTLTVEDRVPGTAAAQKSLADPLREDLAIMQKLGAPTRMQLPLVEKISQIAQHEAAAASSAATQQTQQVKAGVEKAKRISSFAQAALDTPEAYPQLKMQAAQEGFKVDALPPEWNAKALTALRDSGIEAAKMLQLKETASLDAAHKARWGASNAQSAAAVKLAGARTDLVKERLDVLKKTGGEGSPEVKAGREELRLSREALRKARDRKEFPPAPLDPAAREVGKNYTAANGARFMWTKDPASGKPVAVLLSPPPGTKAAAAIAARPAAAVPAEAESADEDSGESAEE